MKKAIGIILTTTCFCLFQKMNWAQPNPVTNFSFENGSSPTGWITNNHNGTSSTSTSVVRSGTRSYSNNTNTRTTTGYIENNNSITVPSGKYLILIAHYRVSANNSTSRVQLGVSGDMGSVVTPAANNTTYQLTRVIQNTTGSEQIYKPRLNMYLSSGSSSRNFFWDDIIAYVCNNPTVDLTEPNTPTDLSVNYTSNNATISWINGTDNTGGCGVARTIILRSNLTCPATAPDLTNQAAYSSSGGYGLSTIGSWTVLDTVNASVLSYTDNTITQGTNYAYAIVHEDKAYNHSPAALVYVPVAASTSPTSPTNGQNNVSYSPSLPTLSWPTICGAYSYDLYFSANSSLVNTNDPSAFLSNLTGTNYTLTTPLVAGTTYFWKIIPKNQSGNAATGCPTWTFTTAIPNLSFEIARNTGISYNSIAQSGNSFSWSGTYNADDKMSDALDLTSLGFTGFRFQDKPVTALEVNSNGFITFNLSSNASYTNNFSSQTQIIAPFWEDLVCQGYMSGQSQTTQRSLLENSMKYLITGTRGNQILTIEWSEMEIYNNPGPSLNFQIKLYEQNNKIEFVYGKMYGFNGTVNYTYSYSIGLSGATVNSTPTSGQLICQQLANVRNFNNTNTNNLSELPDCYSMLSFIPESSPSASNETTPSVINDNCTTAIPLAIHVGIQNDFCQTYSSKQASASSGIPACTATSPGNADDDVWFKFTATTSGNYAITVNGSGSYNPVIQLFSGNCNTLSSIACVNATGNGLIETLTANGLAEGTYFIRIYDANNGAGGSGNFNISVYNILPPPSNDNCIGATALTIGVATGSGNTSNATPSSGIAVCSAGSPGTPDDDVWYSFVATSNITRIMVDGGSSFNCVVQYFSGTCGNLNNLGCVSSTGASGIETADVSTTIGTTYYVRVYHSANGATPTTGFSILIENIIPNCPVLTAPVNGVSSINKSNAQTLSWTASTIPSTGTKTYTVQLSTNPDFSQLVTLSNASGLTGTSYSIPANTLNTNTVYYWRVLCSNSNGTSASCTYNTFATIGTNPSCAVLNSPSNTSNNVDINPLLQWAAGSGNPTSYDVYLGTNQSQVTSLQSSTRVATSHTGNSYIANNLNHSTLYFWTVIPKNTSGNASGCYTGSFTTVAAPPSNDNCNGAINIPLSTLVNGTTLNASQSLVGLAGNADDDVWFSFTASSTSHHIKIQPSSSFNVVAELYSGTCNSLTSLSCVNAAGNGGSEILSPTGLTPNETYYIRVYDFGTGTPVDPTFNIHMSNIDVGISGFSSPTTNNCGNTTVIATLRNFSQSTIDFATHPVTVGGYATAPGNINTQFTDVTINSGSLAAGASQQITLTTNYIVNNSGTYSYTAIASTANDNNITNNTYSASLQTITLPSPFILSGTGSYCAGGNGVTFTLSGSETGVNYQLYLAGNPASSVLSGTGSALNFNNVTSEGSYRVVATQNTTGCVSYMSASSVVSVNPLWLGINSNWNDPANWCGNVVPPPNSNIIISGLAVNMPVLPTDITVNNLELTEANKSIDLNGKNLIINGAISGSGKVKGNTNSSITINGSGNMGKLRMDQSNPGVTNRIKNLNINIGTGTENDSVELDNTVEITGTLTLMKGKLNTNSNLVLTSNASGTARIATIPAGADINGNIVSQRYIPALTRRYRNISPNTTGFTFNDLKDDILITGPGGISNGFDASPQNSSTIFTYQESTTGGRGWKAITNINQTLNAGQGAMVFVRGDRSLPAPQWYTAPFVAQNEVVTDFVGPVNKGNISPVITYTNTGVPANDGWNLIGNPYPSEIDWTLVTKSNLASFIYILDPATNSYVTNDGSTPVASGQAFFIQATAASPSVTFTESCKINSTANGYFKSGNNNRFTIKMVRDSLNSDLAWLRLANGASINYQPQEDAIKFPNSGINMGFKVPSNSTSVQLNTIPPFTNTSDTFIIFANAAPNSYSLEFSGLQHIPSNKAILLRDLHTNTLQDIRSNTTYSFNITSSTSSQGERFQLIIIDQSSLPVEFMGVNATLMQNNINVSWSTASEINNDHFIVEKSNDNLTFQSTGVVNGAGNSNVELMYSFMDVDAIGIARSAGVDKIYYRIKQVDKDGKYQYSNTISVDITKDQLTKPSSFSPNPANQVIYIQIGDNTNQNTPVKIIDLTGKTVLNQNIEGAFATIDVNELNTGIYFLQIGNGKLQKLIIRH